VLQGKEPAFGGEGRPQGWTVLKIKNTNNSYMLFNCHMFVAKKHEIVKRVFKILKRS
jgi:hypothetical protein